MNLMVRNDVFIINIVSFKECLDGFFGSECLKKCGFCMNVSYCHHINGSCLNGCSNGYKGVYCNEGKLNVKIPVSFFLHCKIVFKIFVK